MGDILHIGRSLLRAFPLFLALSAWSQAPSTTAVTGKLRDFREVVDGNDRSHPLTHPDFNDRACGLLTGAVAQTLSTAGAIGDTAVFAMDNREPALVNGYGNGGTRCYESQAHFTDWFNDKSMNRPFLTDIVFTRQADGTYVFDDGEYFPLDSGSGEYRNLPGRTDAPFGHLNSCCMDHNYGFTLEFHATFTYIAGANQVFNFRGNDDLWVFVNGKLAIDLGGVHTALSQGFNLDAIAGSHGLADGQAYVLDFYFAQRHTTQSSLRVTTTLLLDRTPKVATPVATPATGPFASRLDVSLSTSTPAPTRIYYTIDGTPPDSASQPYQAGVPIAVTGTTTLKAVAYKEGWAPSEVMTAAYVKTFSASSLDILDAHGNPLAGGCLTELDTAYTVRISTTQAGLAVLAPTAITQAAADSETLGITHRSVTGDRFVFSGTVSFGIAAKAANGATEASAYDSLAVSWINPRDANDTAGKKVRVRPAPKAARLHFSTRPDGADTTIRYPDSAGRAYIVVHDQVQPSGTPVKADLSVRPFEAPAPDQSETVSLAPVAGYPGRYVGGISLVDGDPVSGDARLQVRRGDRITAGYADPTDLESPVVALAEYGTPAPVGLPFGTAPGPLWEIAAGRLWVPAWSADPPRSIACYDATGAWAGWGRPASRAGLWELPSATGRRILEIRWADGRTLRQVLP